MLLEWRTCATLAAHLCYLSGTPVLLTSESVALEVLLDVAGEGSVVLVVVHQNLAVLQQGGTGADVEGVGQVVAGNDDGGTCRIRADTSWPTARRGRGN